MKIAVFPLEGVGHLNPLFAVVSQLLAKGHHVRFFVASERLEEHIRKLPYENVEVEEVLEFEKGTKMDKSIMKEVPDYEDQDPSDQKVGDFWLLHMPKGWKSFPRLKKAVEEYNPDLILHDTHFGSAAMLARILNIPVVSHMTLPSFNHFVILCGKHTKQEKAQAFDDIKNSKTIKKYRDLYLENYGFDLFSDAVPANYYCKEGLTICTGVKEFELEMPEAVKPIYGGMDKNCVYVGPMLLSEEQGRVSTLSDGGTYEKQWLDEPFPYEQLKKYKDEGRKILYFSLGTVATGSFFWDYEGTPEKMLGAASSGKAFCRGLWKRAFEAFGEKKGYVVVMASQSQQPDALEGLEIPSNFIIRRKCPQLEVLKVADAFVTHGGANSVMESITAKVPMLVLPYFADQFDNAKMVSKQGMGLHYDDPLSECTDIGKDVERLLKFEKFFTANCKRIAKKLEEAGGAVKAAAEIEKYMANFTGHKPLLKKSTSSKSCFESGQFERCRTGSFKENDLFLESSLREGQV